MLRSLLRTNARSTFCKSSYISEGINPCFFQELEDQLQEEENKVNHLNKLKGKLEGEIDEVGERNLVGKKRRRGSAVICIATCQIPDLDRGRTFILWSFP